MKITGYKSCLIFAGVVVLCMFLTYRSTATEYKVYLLGGQSNGDGRGYNTGLPLELQSEQTDVRIYYDDLFDSTDNNPCWQNLRPGLSGGYGQGGPGGTTQFGPEVTFGRTMADAMPDEHVAIVKYAYSGTNLYEHWKSGDPKGVHYQKFLDTVDSALDALENDGHSWTISGMLWMQGEGDADSTEEHASNYETNLTNLIQSVRSELSVPDMRFVIGQLANSKPYPYGDVVQQAQYNASQNVSNTLLVVTDDLGLQGDNVHYNASGQQALGERFANQMLVPEPSTFVLLGSGVLLLLLIRRRRRRR